MAEEKEERKKASIIKQIFKWLGLGLITFLLIVSIIFQAPWKVITLFAVIFLACTILPKPYRKYFWLSVAAVVIALIIWVFLPEETEGWRPYTFNEELATLEAKRSVPIEENAATIYNQLLESYDPNFYNKDFLFHGRDEVILSEFWESEDYPEVAQWLRDNQQIIDQLILACQKDKCRFPIFANTADLSTQMAHISPMRKWARLIISAANNDMAEGRIDKALEKYITVLQMGKHLYQQPVLINFLVGAGLEMLSTKPLKRFIVTGDAAEEHLNLIEQALVEIKHDWSYDWPRILDGEKLLAKNFWGMFYEVNPAGKTRLTRSSGQYNKEKIIKKKMTYWRKRLMKAWSIWYWFYMPSTPQKAGAIIDAAYERYYAMAKPDYDWQKGTGKSTKIFRLNYGYLVDYLFGILEPAFYSIHDAYLRTIARQRGAQLTIALRRYKNKTGHWPESLDEIKSLAPSEIFIDPINGGSFIYKLTDENFTLYSKGKNNIDEYGGYNANGGQPIADVEEDDIPIWPSQ